MSLTGQGNFVGPCRYLCVLQQARRETAGAYKKLHPQQDASCEFIRKNIY